MSTVSPGFFKQLRKDVLNKASNTKIHQFLNSIFEEGFRQGILHCTKQLKEQLNNVSNQESSTSSNDDRIIIQSEGDEPSRSEGTSTVDGDWNEGSDAELPTAPDEGQDGPTA